MRFSDEILMAYADHELDEKTRMAVEAALAEDPEIAGRIAQHQALRNRLQSAFRPVLDEPIPGRLTDAVRGAQAADRAPTARNVVRLPHRGVRPASPPSWLALAASLVIGLLVGWFAFRVGGSGPLALRSDHLLARGELANALTHQLVARQSAVQPIRIGVSFLSRSGEYCRTFSMRAPEIAGLACRAAAGWRLQVLTAAESDSGAPGSYRQAASFMPPAVVAVVTAEIAGQPLDARAEAAARDHGWRD